MINWMYLFHVKIIHKITCKNNDSTWNLKNIKGMVIWTAVTGAYYQTLAQKIPL